MQHITAKEIADATMGHIICGDGTTEIKSITTDSRKAGEGALFVPIAGENHDAHDFIASAFENGASCVITHKDIEIPEGKTAIRVLDTKKAFGDIARYYKRKYNVPTAAVTGSVGKTTTKDMLYAVMSMKYNTLKTEGNFNNDIGVPITVLRLESEHEAAIIEMGMNHTGEIDYLAGIAEPDAAVITNIGISHIENLGSRENIFKAKMEIANRFGKDNTLIVNGDDDYLKNVRGMGEYKAVYYGVENPECDVKGKDIVNKGLDGIEFTAVCDGEEYLIKVKQPGVHNVYNALAAVALGRYFGIGMDKIAKGIENCKFTGMRMETEKCGGRIFVKDYYNASVASVTAALSVMKTEENYRRVAILGDILEMGEIAPKEHYKLGADVVNSGIKLLITAGENGEYIAKGARDGGMEDVYSFNTTEEAAEFARDNIKENDAVLIKASRGMHFEKIYEQLKKGAEK